MFLKLGDLIKSLKHIVSFVLVAFSLSTEMHDIVDLLNKKRQGQDLTWEEIEYFIRAIQNAGIREAQAG